MNVHGKEELVRSGPNEQPKSDKVDADTGASISINGSANYRRSAHDAAGDLISLAGRGDQVGRQLVKRIFDLMVASALAVIFFPFVIVVALFVRKSGAPVLFAHTRVGRGGQKFRCYKFRTMHTDANLRLREILDSDPEAYAQWYGRRKLKDDPRVTRTGRFLRKTSLDEIPQLINVFRGEMSIVGPRPIVAEEAAQYGSNFIAYKSVRPGITGLWQVSGRSNTTYNQRVALDVQYIKESSLLLDIQILLKTILVVCNRIGAY